MECVYSLIWDKYDFVVAIILFSVITLVLTVLAKRYKWVSSRSRWWEILGVMFRPKVTIGYYIGIPAAVLLHHYCYVEWSFFVVATVLLGSAWYSVVKLNKIYLINGEEEGITYSQLALLIVMGIWVVSFFWVLKYLNNTSLSVIVTGTGGIMGWIFQDSIKGIVTFFLLRFGGLLKLGDWIEVKSHGVDGVIRRISLTTVTIENWDTTTSSFPIHILQDEHFKNYQKMLEGRTYGRLMQKTFIIDTSWIHSVTEEELANLRKILAERKTADQDYYEYYISHEAKPNELNIHLYREYLYHWLMHNQHVSQEPYVIVRWMEQVPEGLPLQIYIFLLDSSLASFEWNQSLIIEHIVESLSWFNLQLYQSVSGYDAGNANVFLTTTKANYKKDQNNG